MISRPINLFVTHPARNRDVTRAARVDDARRLRFTAARTIFSSILLGTS